MMVGKRSGRPAPARSHMRRTTSMTEFAPPDLLAGVPEAELEEDEEAEELQLLPAAHAEGDHQAQAAAGEELFGWAVAGGGCASGRAPDWLAAYRARAAPALAGLRRNSAAETAAFLRACGLCNRRLGPGRDTFMYRGDTAFCSLECRQQHITIEEWKEKCALATPQTAPPPASSEPVVLPPAASRSDKPGTVAAA